MKEKEKICLYHGFPMDAKSTLEQLIDSGQLRLIEPEEGMKYHLDTGIYSLNIEKKNVCHILKIFVIKEPKTINLSDYATEAMMVLTEDGFEDGWQPTGYPKLAPEKFRRDQRDMMLCIWPDELLEKFGGVEVPAVHQVMSQAELMNKLKDMEKTCDFMKLYSMGKTEHLGFDFPLLVFSTETGLPSSEKITVWYQAQVHGNEPASCDGALEIIKRMIDDPLYYSMLDKINLIVVPRVNPEAAYLYRRMNYASIDLNRDHMEEQGYETRILHQAFQKYMPDVVLDAHEFISYELEENEGEIVTKRGCDLMTSPSTSLNINANIRDLSLQISGKVFSACRDTGMNINHFGITANPSIGRTYFALQNCLSFLIETRGIGAGKYFYRRRIEAQVTAVTAYLRQIEDNAAKVKEVVKNARCLQEELEEVVLQQEASGETVTGYWGTDTRYLLDGTEVKSERIHMPLSDCVLRKRKKPSAYILSSTLPHIEKILKKAENMGIQYEVIPPGRKMELQQYKYLGKRPESELEEDILSERMPAKEYCFTEPVYEFPTNQSAGMLLALLMEPDVTDSVGTKGTLYQQNLLICEDIFCRA